MALIEQLADLYPEQHRRDRWRRRVHEPNIAGCPAPEYPVPKLAHGR
jgi:hypothetical protein